MSATEIAALLTAAAALVGALVAMVRELREFRKDVVSAVERHSESTRSMLTSAAGSADPQSPRLP